MALTLAEANKLSNDVLKAGVIETIVKESPIFGLLPFIDIVGTALRYNRENAAAGAEFRAVGGTWTEGTPTFTEVTVGLKILGGDADVDKFLQATRSNVQDLEAAVLELKAKAVAHEFEDEVVYGDVDDDSLGFDGLHALVPSTQRVSIGSGTTGAALSLKKLDEMVDKVKPGKPDFLMMSRRTRRGISAYARALTSPVTYEPREFGQRAMFWDGIPVLVNDFMTDTEALASGAFSAKTGGQTSSIFAAKVGEDALAGLTNGGLQIEGIGALETKDANRWRVKMYAALALFDELKVACLDGITAADVTA